MKLWQKDNNSPSGVGGAIEQFTVGNDRNFDLQLAPFDVLGKYCACKNVSNRWLAYKWRS